MYRSYRPRKTHIAAVTSTSHHVLSSFDSAQIFRFLIQTQDHNYLRFLSEYSFLWTETLIFNFTLQKHRRFSDIVIILFDPNDVIWRKAATPWALSNVRGALTHMTI